MTTYASLSAVPLRARAPVSPSTRRTGDPPLNVTSKSVARTFGLIEKAAHRQTRLDGETIAEASELTVFVRRQHVALEVVGELEAVECQAHTQHHE